MSEIKLLIQLKENLEHFLDELIETFPKEPDFLIARVLIGAKETQDIMEYVITDICPYEKRIENKDDKLFTEDKITFGFSKQKGKSDNFKNLWITGALSGDNKDVVWNWFKTFVIIANRYVEEKNKK
jgi:hypothetical protein